MLFYSKEFFRGIGCVPYKENGYLPSNQKGR